MSPESECRTRSGEATVAAALRLIYLGHVGDKIHHAVTVTVFVVVPATAIRNNGIT